MSANGAQAAGAGLQLGQVAKTYASVTIWIGLSSGLIFFNKYLLDTRQFNFPLCLTMVRTTARRATFPLSSAFHTSATLSLSRRCLASGLTSVHLPRPTLCVFAPHRPLPLDRSTWPSAASWPRS